MQALLLGIDGLSYARFLDCNATTLLGLVDSAERGVVENRKDLTPCASWKEVLGIADEKDLESSPLLRALSPVLINVPIRNPTVGLCPQDLSSSNGLEEEIDCVERSIRENLPQRPVIAAVTALARTDPERACALYKRADSLVQRLLAFANHFIIFSSFGVLEGGCKEKFGVYLATLRRPRSRDTVKPEEIGQLFLRMQNSLSA